MPVNETREIPVDSVLVASNFRRHFDEQKMKELTANVKEFGVLEPILVRSEEGREGFTLIAGERRLRAAKGAGLKTVPARILSVDADVAAEIQLLENLHREDLGPVAEAHALHALMQGGKTVEALAERIDKSVAYVYRAVRLVELPKTALDAIEAGKLTAAHGHQILRAPEEKRGELVEFALEMSQHRAFPAYELRNHIEARFSADLGEACFPKGKPYAGEMACTGCPFNSGNQGQLFDGAEKGKCNNPDCFKKKTGVFLEEYSKEAAGDHPGVQYLGIQTADYSGGIKDMKRARVVCGPDGAVPREISKALKEKPEKFGWCVLAPRGRGDKPTHVLVCLDPKLLRTESEQALRKMNRNVRGAVAREDEREDFVRHAVQRAIEEAVADTIPPRTRFDFTEAQWGILIDALNDALPVFKIDGKADRHLAQAVLIRATMLNPDWQTSLGILGINYKKIEQETTKAAEKEWERLQKEKAAAG